MNSELRYLARLAFANRIFAANDNSFQKLFSAVMLATHGTEFIEILPQGRDGDGGNDGYLPGVGHYYQVYGPVNPKDKITIGAKKAIDDFEKINNSWNQVTPIQAYSFVYNDKYCGVFKNLALAVGEIAKSHPEIKCRLFTAAHLESVFMRLDQNAIEGILNLPLPDPAKMKNVDYRVLRDVINDIMNYPYNSSETRFGALPELGQKIQLNKLCEHWEIIIRNGARQAGHVEKYFENGSTFQKQELRGKIVEIYKSVRDQIKSQEKLPDEVVLEDLIFSKFWERILPDGATMATSAMVGMLIGFYFETCDIFDPHASKDSPNASA